MRCRCAGPFENIVFENVHPFVVSVTFVVSVCKDFGGVSIGHPGRSLVGSFFFVLA